MSRPSFLDQEAPPGYIAGVGRGATGFSTRGQKQGDISRVPKRYLEKEQNTGSHESDDEDVFAALDERINNKRKRKGNDRNSKAHIKIEDLKPKINSISEEQWLNLPEAVDITRANRRARMEEQLNRRTYAAPDSLIKSKGVDLSKLTEERERILARQLDTDFFDDTKNEDITSKYLSELENDKSQLNIEDNEEVQKRRLILQSYRRTEPKDATSWISSARLEEHCGNYSAARSLIQQGCIECPRDEEIWLENIRMNESDIVTRKVLTANALRFIPKSTNLWLRAIEFESERSNKYRVVRRALKEIPYSLEFWKLAVKFERDRSEVIRILKKALEFLPDSEDFWIALFDLTPYSDVKTLLLEFMKSQPSDKNLFLFRAMLEEKNRNTISLSEIKEILRPAFSEINMEIRDVLQWVERAGSLATSGNFELSSFILTDMILGSLNSKVLDTVNTEIMSKSQSSLIRIALTKNLLRFQPEKLKLWTELRSECMASGHSTIFFEIFDELLFEDTDKKTLITKHPNLSILYAKELWKHYKSPKKVLDLLDKILLNLPHFLEGWFAKLKIVMQLHDISSAESIFKNLLGFVNDSTLTLREEERIAYKYIDFLRYCDNNKAAINLVRNQFLPKYSSCYKIHLQLAQMNEYLNLYDDTIRVYEHAIEVVPKSPTLWIEYSKFMEIRMKNLMKARSILDIGMLQLPDNPKLLSARIELEMRQDNIDQADLLISQGIQKFRKDEWMWVLCMRRAKEKKSVYKKTLFQDALKSTDNSSLVLFEIGKSFFRENQFIIALKWIDRALSKNKKYGDLWLYKAFCLESLKKDIQVCKDAVLEEEPKYGEEWVRISKDIKSIYLTASEVFDILLSKNQNGTYN
ncbi:hypothetical protein RNJ44_02038 [Nakaseomyces bracarensis]|uniref:PRP1 splicing factor N-terminal domain-containing protein n=1 Tax=Nakaseomyces bracarensis TaxID=273131 RepID=A0ABR4NMB2_9SACH